MGLKKWVFRPTDKALAKEIAEECALDPVVTMIAVARGYTDPWLIEELLSDELMLNNPYTLCDLSIAVERIRIAMQSKEKILIFGDYDCDGVTATVLLYSYLSKKGADVQYFLPRRDMDGYGLNTATVEKYAKEGISLIITVDNGISAFEAIDTANAHNVDVIVTDHHLPQDALPNAYCVIDPHREDDASEFKSLSGVGVAFKLVCAVEGVAPEEMLPHFADLVALGTIADVMPLLDENRSIVKAGLFHMASTPRPGIKALIDVCGLREKPLTATSVAFAMAPRINAAGRICDADIAAQLLLSNHYNTSYQLAHELNDYNFQRQEIEQEILRDAFSQIEEGDMDEDAVLVLSAGGWQCGVVGIAAARIAEQYGKPCILFSVDGEEATGSGRSVPGFDLFAALQNTEELLLRYGGHAQAAGATIQTENIANFRAAINRYAQTIPTVFSPLTLDCKLNPAAVTVDFVKALSAMEPYGTGNVIPLFALTDMIISRIDMVGKDKQHMRITAIKGGTSIHAIAFSSCAADFGIAIKDKVDLAVTLSLQEYNGRDTVNIVIRDIRAAGRNEDDFFKGLLNYKSFRRELPETDYASLHPSRNDFIAVFRYIRDVGEVTLSGLQNRFSTTFSPDKVTVIVDCLEELGIFSVCKQGAEIKIKNLDNGRKVALEQSVILHSISEKNKSTIK
ncbi:MAG: single-stranded-DNA-specific exonuclease RecJ [Clostridia bacterium]|nr:single-stranded-DNA-specific exonuclease RecJ [Clostridia bacterium]MBQ7289182.1 single-stranded-DNA-specific exonuclease RecJ [Clostridia bacterium]